MMAPLVTVMGPFFLPSPSVGGWFAGYPKIFLDRIQWIAQQLPQVFPATIGMREIEMMKNRLFFLIMKNRKIGERCFVYLHNVSYELRV